MDDATIGAALRAQRNELTEHLIYGQLAKRDRKNGKALQRIADDERRHHDFWKRLTKQDVEPNRPFIRLYLFLARIFGVVFAVRLMERGERGAQEAYRKLTGTNGVPAILKDEQHHEQLLIGMIKEERLEYAGSVVLGLNDALVELTGVLAGLTLAINNSKVVALAGLITGVAAALSMAASAYLSSQEEADQNAEKSPLKSAVYTGVAYLLTVLLLVTPYFLGIGIYASLGITLTLALLIIAGYTFYITVAKNLPFWRRFLGMVVISLVVAALSFAFGWILKTWLGVSV
jgi:vacuolar iron transporter family protein